MKRANSLEVDYNRAALNGNVRDIISKLSLYKNLNKKSKRLKSKIQKRFIDNNDLGKINVSDKFVKELILNYRKYYSKALIGKHTEAELYDALNQICFRFCKIKTTKASWIKLENNLQKELEKRGYFSLFGEILPFKSLLIWKKKSEKEFRVKLPLGEQKVKVIFLEDFIELGWVDFATFGMHHVGGWAKRDALFCVKKGYDINSEKFLISYLSHEAEHFMDYKLFPKLKQIDLEYRAKLVEILNSSYPKKVYVKFSNNTDTKRANPHSCSAHFLVKNMIVESNRFFANKNINILKSHQIKQLACALFEKHTKMLKKIGARKTTGVL